MYFHGQAIATRIGHLNSIGPQAQPAAIVLCTASTGMGLLRSLAVKGINVHAAMLDSNDPLRVSRYGTKIDLAGVSSEDDLLEFLIRYSKKLGNRPVLFPSSDAQALLIAKNADVLSTVSRSSGTTYGDLLDIVCKNGLYRAADAIGVETVPYVVARDAEHLAQWSSLNAEPYLLKPFYEAIPTSPIAGKNLVLQSREALLDFAGKHDPRAFVVQRILRGGDGYIFDCYGYRNRDGRVLTMASHRRWRQLLPDFGSTSMGEIPSGLEASQENHLFKETTRLLDAVRHHGIFGVEWLLERESGKFYMIDFNARPFSTIGHLTACGLNLPAMAYADLIGEDNNRAGHHLILKRFRWADLSRDLDSFVIKHRAHEITTLSWVWSLAGCQKFAYLSWRDPIPGIYRVTSIIRRVLRFALREIVSLLTPATSARSKR